MFESIKRDRPIVLHIAELIEHPEIVPMRALPGEIVGFAP
jgi:hypothetical protein